MWGRQVKMRDPEHLNGLFQDPTAGIRTRASWLLFFHQQGRSWVGSRGLRERSWKEYGPSLTSQRQVLTNLEGQLVLESSGASYLNFMSTMWGQYFCVAPSPHLPPPTFLETRKLRLRGDKWPAQGHTVVMWNFNHCLIALWFLCASASSSVKWGNQNTCLAGLLWGFSKGRHFYKVLRKAPGT